jgi:hypothetical protein
MKAGHGMGAGATTGIVVGSLMGVALLGYAVSNFAPLWPRPVEAQRLMSDTSPRSSRRSGRHMRVGPA